MMRAKVFHNGNNYNRPLFWGIDRDLKDVIDDIEQVWSGANAATKTSRFTETDQGYFMALDVPGLNKSHLEIQQEGNYLHVKGKRKQGSPETLEVEHSVSETFLLPQGVDADKIQAHCEDGVLFLALPKLEKARAKKVEITEGDAKPSWKNLLGNARFTRKDTQSTVVN